MSGPTLEALRDRLGDRADDVSEDDLWCLLEDWETSPHRETFDVHAVLDEMESAR